MKHKTKIRIDFSVFGESFNPNELTRLVDIIPTSTGLKGQLIPNRNITCKECAWDYSTGPRETLQFDDLSTQVVTLFKNKISIINDFVAQHNLSIKIFVVIEIQQKQPPSLYLDKEFLMFVNNINAEIDMDLYII